MSETVIWDMSETATCSLQASRNTENTWKTEKEAAWMESCEADIVKGFHSICCFHAYRIGEKKTG